MTVETQFCPGFTLAMLIYGKDLLAFIEKGLLQSNQPSMSPSAVLMRTSHGWQNCQYK